jgi:hypothetical protein
MGIGVIKYLRHANKLCYRFGDKNRNIFLKLCHICMNQMMIYGMLARSKLSPFENTRPCVARHMNNKIEHDTIFYNDDDCYKKA